MARLLSHFNAELDAEQGEIPELRVAELGKLHSCSREHFHHNVRFALDDTLHLFGCKRVLHAVIRLIISRDVQFAHITNNLIIVASI
jgi:hypothetical protein